MSSLLHMFDPPLFCRQKLGFNPDPWQTRVLLSPSKRILLNCCRQSGKSTISAALATHEAFFFPGSLSLVFAPSLRQSNLTFDVMAGFVDRLGPGVVAEKTKTSIRLTNGSRLVCLPASPDTVRGFSAVTLMIIDEAARVEGSLYHAIRPMLAASNGRLILGSTPAGMTDHFFPAAWHGESDWEKHKVTAAQCPRISKAFLAEERRTLGPRAFAAEYECSFTDSTDQVFSYDVVMAMLSDDVQAVYPDAREVATDALVADITVPLSPGDGSS